VSFYTSDWPDAHEQRKKENTSRVTGCPYLLVKPFWLDMDKYFFSWSMSESIVLFYPIHSSLMEWHAMHIFLSKQMVPMKRKGFFFLLRSSHDSVINSGTKKQITNLLPGLSLIYSYSQCWPNDNMITKFDTHDIEKGVVCRNESKWGQQTELYKKNFFYNTLQRQW